MLLQQDTPLPASGADGASGVQVCSLGSLELLEPSRYPSFTLLGQAWGSVRLAWRALNTTRPEVSCPKMFCQGRKAKRCGMRRLLRMGGRYSLNRVTTPAVGMLTCWPWGHGPCSAAGSAQRSAVIDPVQLGQKLLISISESSRTIAPGLSCVSAQGPVNVGRDITKHRVHIVSRWSTGKSCIMQVWVDTAGWAATYPLALIAGCGVAAYVHYPMVSR